MTTKRKTKAQKEAEEKAASGRSASYNPTKAAAQIAIQHRRLMESMTQQGPSEIAAAMDNLECAINKARSDLGLD